MKTPYNFIDREISWLYFNQRVLQEAADKTVPLIERLKFLGIYSNNLDEFFRVRVAALNRMSDWDNKPKGVFDNNPKKTLKKIMEIDAAAQLRFQEVFKEIVAELEKEKILIITEKELNKTQGNFVRTYFQEHVRPFLFPIMLGSSDFNFPLKDKSIYLGITMIKKGKLMREKFALIKLPTSNVSRFLVLPAIDEKRYIILLDDIIRYCLDEIFSIFNYDEINAYTIKITRDAELDFDMDISKSFLEIISESLKKRSIGLPVRFIYDSEIPESLLKDLTKKLNISQHDTLTQAGRYHNFKDFINFPNLGAKDLEFEALPPLQHKDLQVTNSIFRKLKQKDIMLHYPYQSFHPIIDLLREASIDPKVKSIRMTLYRLAKDSNVINALINAVRNGKSVTVYMELQARFDEEANILYTTKLQEEGVKLIQGIPGFKVHAKLLLIRRKEGGASSYYANIGTGNFNESTTKLYADDSLLTCDPAIAHDVLKIFELLENNYKQQKFNSLILSPIKMRNHFIGLLKKEIINAKAGKEAWAILKLNNLADTMIAKQIAKAAENGVRINLIVRGSCILLPDSTFIGKNLEAIGIIDRFLEHSRVFVFANGGEPKYFISSADWMIRNFDNRIEVALPIFDKEIQKELMDMLLLQLADNTKARFHSLLQPNKYKKNSRKLLRSQEAIYYYFKKKLNDYTQD
jgi:polyphosphate kinase